MTTEPKVEEQVVPGLAPESPVPAVDPQATGTEAEKLDYRALYEASQEEAVQLRQEATRIRAAELGILTQAERDIDTRQTKEQIRVLAEALGDPEVSARLTDIQQKHQSQVTDAAFLAEKNSVGAEVLALGESLGVDPSEHPAFSAALRYWANAERTGDSAALNRSLAEAHKAARKIESEGHAQALVDGKKQERDELLRQRALEEADTDIGASGGSGGQDTDALRQAYINNPDNPAIKARYIAWRTSRGL